MRYQKVLLTSLILLFASQGFASHKNKCDYVEFKAQPAPRYHYKETCITPEDIYNPDLSTGDDDVLHHPDMNIDN